MEHDFNQSEYDAGFIERTASRVTDVFSSIPYSDLLADFGLFAGIEVAFLLGVPAIGLFAITGYLFGAMTSSAIRSPKATILGFCWGLVIFAMLFGVIGIVLGRAAIRGNLFPGLLALAFLAMPVGIMAGSLERMRRREQSGDL